ncbi:ESX-1 secretion-associated protein [Nocardia sp. NBC_01503]|uniref:type VII secretion target n=1 Tax=Nocardia sp. NBC_01503 TaxID=2975997 RepID=UPI002E7AE7BD|nr:type VII secretion target [Nocardia sp. NBC_01503]WTL34202.1 ESX-1 secretion-associated protein [Nocardia sp. NBC_01503]
MQVSPEELRDAANTFDGIVGAVGKLPVIDTASGVLGTLGSFMQGSDTGPELDRIEAVRAKAIPIVSGRYQEFAAVLRESADTYHGSDQDSAARFDALGDFNSGAGA